MTNKYPKYEIAIRVRINGEMQNVTDRKPQEPWTMILLAHFDIWTDAA